MLGERIDQGSAEALKIIHITSNYRQSANQCGRSNERIFKMVVRASVHELGPTTEDASLVLLRDAVSRLRSREREYGLPASGVDPFLPGRGRPLCDEQTTSNKRNNQMERIDHLPPVA
jgi:hypothetical protein